VPVVSTSLYYTLPPSLQNYMAIQFFPQAVAYLALVFWATLNGKITQRIGLAPTQITQGLRWGTVTGLVLGGINVLVVLWVVPALGGDILFLRDTPHAQVPTVIMLPWLITLIAVGVEVNFRGFVLGRLLALFASEPTSRRARIGSALAVAISAATFAFDPFMVATFKHLHWIAVWDGLVWGTMWLRLHNLYGPIVAHTVEVVVMYSIIKVTLT
jgi:hypothetical protein